ncbi:MAG TPA: tannase/feruloyl esterase family alpha/beta hydrolase [Bryobacteraceae bacterium]|nr:tannase/feruloyl esterase family alpha/beta hydrolase [Bryobacteraceae bacterium]
MQNFSTHILLLGAICGPLAAAESCDGLSGLELPDTVITLAKTVAAGAFALPVPATAPPAQALAARSQFQDLPGFCRVALDIHPTKDSDIRVEVWLPAAGWNGKFVGVGNGGWSGGIVYPLLRQALTRGYAAASTDTGHRGSDASFAVGHPEKLVDFGYRAVHEMTLKAKSVISAYYGRGPRLSYWNGCSSGGKQGLKEAQRFPSDYDAIMAGAPANYWTHLMAGDLWPAQATLKDPAAYLTKEKYFLIHRAILDACDAADGVKDGVLEDPARCRFDLKALACEGDDGPGCLTAPQLAAARKIYAGATNPRTGEQIFPGMVPGSELVWGALAGGPKPFAIPESHFRHIVFKDPDWDFRTLNFDRDVALADKLDNGLLNAIDPDLKSFVERGGKLILYHGWNDQLIAPQNSINYYSSVADALGGASKIHSAIRLFMAPGMNHCSGGDGPSAFDHLAILDEWRDKGKAPDQIIASHLTDSKPDRTRPLCPYPQIAKYKGTGSTDEAENFTCALP